MLLLGELVATQFKIRYGFIDLELHVIFLLIIFLLSSQSLDSSPCTLLDQSMGLN